jgi:tRNA threonylcarbamoyladenosine biosynthesis protein TsaB
MKLLAIDTATEALSVAVWNDGEVREHFEVIGRGHAERVLPLVDRLLAEAGWSLASLDAIAFGRGPGAFTGVRIAVSTAQGLAFGAGLPLVPVSDLAALGRRALDAAAAKGTLADAALACLDARMGEVYAALVHGIPQGGVQLAFESLRKPGTLDPGEVAPSLRLVGAGHGWSAYPELAQAWTGRLASIDPDLLPRADEIAALAAIEVAAGRALPADEAQPVYLRDDVATRSHRAP